MIVLGFRDPGKEPPGPEDLGSAADLGAELAAGGPKTTQSAVMGSGCRFRVQGSGFRV